MINSTLKDLENSINNSPLLCMDKEQNGILYDKILCYDFLPNLVQYCELIYTKEKFDKYNGLTFWDTVNKCLANFNCDAGKFINYFNRAFTVNIKREAQRESNQTRRHGIRVNRKIEEIIVILDKYLEAHNWDEDINIDTEDGRLKISQALSIPLKLIEEAVETKKNTVVIRSSIYDKDGEPVNMFDTISSTQPNSLDILTQSDEVKDLFDKIDRQFQRIPPSKEKRRKVFSLFITRQLLGAWDVCDELFISGSEYSFVDSETLRYYEETEELPLDKQLAERCGIKPESFSRIKSELEEFLIEILR